MTPVEQCALRWHAARQERLSWQRKRDSLPEHHPHGSAFERARADAKRIETRALRELAKACALARESLSSAEEGRARPRLPAPDVIDI